MAGPGPSADTPATQGVQQFNLEGKPIPPLPANATNEEKDQHWFKHVYVGDKMPQLTLRAVLTGGILGMLLAASNLYTTLNIGWAFGVAITSSVISFVIWSIITPLVGCRKMTILETNCMASTAIAQIIAPRVMTPLAGFMVFRSSAIGGYNDRSVRQRRAAARVDRPTLRPPPAPSAYPP